MWFLNVRPTAAAPPRRHTAARLPRSKAASRTHAGGKQLLNRFHAIAARSAASAVSSARRISSLLRVVAHGAGASRSAQRWSTISSTARRARNAAMRDDRPTGATRRQDPLSLTEKLDCALIATPAAVSTVRSSSRASFMETQWLRRARRCTDAGCGDVRVWRRASLRSISAGVAVHRQRQPRACLLR